MSLSTEFSNSTRRPRPPKKREAPFSIRLSAEDRARLAMEAAGAPLGAYIKFKLLDGETVGRKRRKGLSIQDREALAQALALLGRSNILSALHDLAEAARTGSLPLTPETEAEFSAALIAVKDLRALLLSALGHKPGDRP